MRRSALEGCSGARASVSGSDAGIQGGFPDFRGAVTAGRLEVARAIAKKLVRLTPWVMPAISELRDFQDLLSSILKYSDVNAVL